jgi:hypothetical protein
MQLLFGVYKEKESMKIYRANLKPDGFFTGVDTNVRMSGKVPHFFLKKCKLAAGNQRHLSKLIVDPYQSHG